MPAKPKLTEQEREQIRDRVKAGESVRQIAKDYPITEQAINRLVKRKGWRRTYVETVTLKQQERIDNPKCLGDVMLRRSGKRTEENAAEILDAIISGCDLETAANCGGMSADTLDRWRQDDPEFDDMVRNAIGIRDKANIDTIVNARKSDWKASSYLLEKQSRGYRHVQTGPGSGGINVVINVPSPKEPVIIDVSATNTGIDSP